MNIILANCPINNGNRGCVALSLSTMFLLDELLNVKKIPHTFYLPQSGFNDMDEHVLKISRLTVKFIAIADISNYSFRNRVYNIIKFKRYIATKRIYKQADVILDIGQGDSFADIYGRDRFNWIVGQYKLGMKYNKPYCILPQTIGPFENRQIRKTAQLAIHYAKTVMVRDKQSYDFVKLLLPNKLVSEIIDVAFFMPYEKKRFDDAYTHVGLNISSLLWHGGYTYNNQFGLNVDYKDLVYSIINFFLSIEKIKVHLIPHVVEGERGVENDYAVSYDLFEEYNSDNLILSPFFLDPIAAKNYISGMDFFIGARMHATIGAFSSGVPVYPLAYSRKFNGLFLETLQYKFMGDMKAQTTDEILNGIKDAFRDRILLNSIIQDRMNGIVAERRRLLIDDLALFLGL